jgi:2-desacetyl-2-hydroxyethyl bacteriochlorophyllide A dehydrogenase
MDELKMLEAKRIVFSEPNVVGLENFTFNPDPAEDEMAIRTLVSIVSAGTELACLAGTEDWAKLPFNPGYGAVGKVIAVGKHVRAFQEGDTVFTHSNHASHAMCRVLTVKVPEGLDPFHAVFVRMASVAMTALRVSSAELGDKVAVVGMGLVGNLAAQLFLLAGCDVMGIDLVEKRLQVARKCGIEMVLNPNEADPVETIRRWTEGRGCEVAVEASGNPQAALLAAELTGRKGEVILLGSPRKPLQANVTDLLRKIHLWQQGCVTFKGAHEWRYPVRDEALGFIKHSIERNTKILLRLIADGKLKVGPLLTHVLPPNRCTEAYEGLRKKPEEYIGVVFDWRSVSS